MYIVFIRYICSINAEIMTKQEFIHLIERFDSIGVKRTLLHQNRSRISHLVGGFTKEPKESELVSIAKNAMPQLEQIRIAFGNLALCKPKELKADIQRMTETGVSKTGFLAKLVRVSSPTFLKWLRGDRLSLRIVSKIEKGLLEESKVMVYDSQKLINQVNEL